MVRLIGRWERGVSVQGLKYQANGHGGLEMCLAQCGTEEEAILAGL